MKEENFVHLYRRDARTIEASRKRLPKKVLSENIKYSEMRYCCVHLASGPATVNIWRPVPDLQLYLLGVGY